MEDVPSQSRHPYVLKAYGHEAKRKLAEVPTILSVMLSHRRNEIFTYSYVIFVSRDKELYFRLIKSANNCRTYEPICYIYIRKNKEIYYVGKSYDME